MIDWIATAELFGYSAPAELTGRKRPKVVCRCDQCNKQRVIAIRVKSRIKNAQMEWVCPACLMRQQNERTTRQATKRWQIKAYRLARQRSSKKLWRSSKYRIKHSQAVLAAMASIDMATVQAKRTITAEDRQKARERSLLNFANPKFRKKHLRAMRKPEVRQKIRTGTHKSWQSVDYREKMLAARLKQLKNPSRIQQMLYQILTDLKVDFVPESEKTAIGFYVFDCLVPRNNKRHLLIECQGDYWHHSETATRKDKAKFTYIERYFPGYQIVYFWEREFYQGTRVRSRLVSLLGLDNQHIDFDFGSVTVNKVKSTKHFLDLYHYLGPGRGGIKFGAFLGDTLIAVAVFSTPQRQNLATKFACKPRQIIECSRFCIHPDYQKRNFASWFLARCVKAFTGKLLVAYADTTVGHSGTLYKAAGWAFHHEVPSDYWYSDVDGFVMHKKTLYNRAVSLKLTEAEFAIQYGYFKIYGGKKLCFVKQT